MALQMKKAVVLAKAEATYGTDPVPTGAANAILVANLSIRPCESDMVARNVIRQWLGNAENLPVASYSIVEFDVELQGAGGAANIAPAWSPLCGACAFPGAVNATVSWDHKPTSTFGASSSVTLYVYVDSVLHKVIGARGNPSITLANKAIPIIHFRFIGKYSASTDASPSGVTYAAFKQPKPVSQQNTPTCTLHAVGVAMSDLSIDFGNTVIFRSLPGAAAEEILITGRALSGSITFEAASIATKDWFATSRAATLAALQVIHGSGTGNISQIDAANVQISNPGYADQDGVAMLQANLVFAPGATGNDELTLLTK